MRYRRVAVIGASGFIGRYVVKRLAARGTVIAAIVRNVCANLAEAYQARGKAA